MTPAPDYLSCLFSGRDRCCDQTQCREFIPAVPGDLKRRLPSCGRVHGDVAEYYGGFPVSDVAWVLGECEKTVIRATSSARAQLRAALGDWSEG
jgi:hypothetical protein